MDLGTEINTRLVGRGCLSTGSGVKIKIIAPGAYSYPDISILCGCPLEAVYRGVELEGATSN